MAEDQDSLASLEDRITRAVQLVRTLREQNEGLQKRLDAAHAELESIKAERDAANQANAEADKYRAELENLKSERKQVRTRIEKLLGQMDLLSNQ